MQAIKKPLLNLTLCIVIGLIATVLTSQKSYAQQLLPADAAESVTNKTGGRILKVQKIRPDKLNQHDYKVKTLLPNGQVKHLIVDGDNGDIKEPKTKR